jgi:hypothetical protein
MSYRLTDDAEKRLEQAIAAATADVVGLLPKVTTEFLDGPEGSSLHIKMFVGRQLDQMTRRHVVRAATNAAVHSLPELTAVPLITLMQAA